MPDKTIWVEFAERFYTQPILGMAEIIAIIIGLKYSRKDKIGRLFIFYITFDFIISIVDWSFSYISMPKHFTKGFIRITNTLISMLELNVYYYFFKTIFQNKKINNFLTILSTAYTLLGIFYIITQFSFISTRSSYISNIIYSIGLALLLPPVGIYFNKLINTYSEINLFARPSFWISVGIFFFCILSTPCYLLISYLQKPENHAYNIIEASLYYTPFTLNILFITKAFLCKKTLTT